MFFPFSAKPLLLQKPGRQVALFFLLSPLPPNSRHMHTLSQGSVCHHPPTAGSSSCSRDSALSTIPPQAQSNCGVKSGEDRARGETRNIPKGRLGSGTSTRQSSAAYYLNLTALAFKGPIPLLIVAICDYFQI